MKSAWYDKKDGYLAKKLNVTSHNWNLSSSFFTFVSQMSSVVFEWILCGKRRGIED